MLKAKIVAVAFAVAMFALPVTGTFAAGHPHAFGGGIYPPAPLTATYGGHWNSALSGIVQMTQAASTTSEIVSQLSATGEQVQNGIGILLGGVAVALGVVLGSVMAIKWLPRLVRRFFPQ